MSQVRIELELVKQYRKDRQAHKAAGGLNRRNTRAAGTERLGARSVSATCDACFRYAIW